MTTTPEHEARAREALSRLLAAVRADYAEFRAAVAADRAALLADLRADMAAAGWTAESAPGLDAEDERLIREERWS